MTSTEGQGIVPGPLHDRGSDDDSVAQRKRDLARAASARLTGKRRGISDRETR